MIYVVAYNLQAAHQVLKQAGVSPDPYMQEIGWHRITRRDAVIVSGPESLRGRRLTQKDYIIYCEGHEDRPDIREVEEALTIASVGSGPQIKKVSRHGFCECNKPIYDPEDYICGGCRSKLPT